MHRDEQCVHPNLIEMQLAHAERNTVRAAHNRAHHLADRRLMLQNRADYVDRLESVETIAIHANTRY